MNITNVSEACDLVKSYFEKGEKEEQEWLSENLAKASDKIKEEASKGLTFCFYDVEMKDHFALAKSTMLSRELMKLGFEVSVELAQRKTNEVLEKRVHAFKVSWKDKSETATTY